MTKKDPRPACAGKRTQNPFSSRVLEAMSAATILYIIITIVLADYLLERTLSFLNCRSISTQLPDEVQGVYSEERYQQSQEYKRANCRFELVTASLKLLLLLALLLSGGFAYI
ncbi:MAG: hypothetical protein Q7U88_11655, partial [Desulfocapsaceae bacterium]|nr:hypothetical protein [Desulfocapsaceae bacterium]